MIEDPSDLKQLIKKDKIIETCAIGIQLHDKRLIAHGERVAFIAHQIFQECKIKNMNLSILLLLCIFHDIGAYKTDEIDNMFQFETRNVHDHSIYGYLFLKYFFPWPEYSEAILYHHKSYKLMHKENCKCYQYASIINLADRIDVAVLNGMKKDEIIASISTCKYNYEQVNALKHILYTTDLYEVLKSKHIINIYEILNNAINITYKDALSLLRMLVYSIDFKSAVTVVHSINTAAIAAYLAKYLNLPFQNIQKINIAALVHDIGKLAIPINILEKTGSLSPKEMDVMREHVMFSEKLLKNILPIDILHIAVRHHEKLDGSGYPYGLTAEQLTLEDRIVAVADIMSALISKRSYKNKFSIVKTINILNSMADRKLIDSTLVQIVSENAEELWDFIQNESKIVNQIYDDFMKEYVQLLKQPQLYS